MSDSQYSNLEQNRIEKLNHLREQGIDPYPAKITRTHTSAEAIQAFESTENAESPEPIQAQLVGRIRSMRPMGKIVFTHIEDGAGRIQLFIRANDVGKEQLELFITKFDLGDFVIAFSIEMILTNFVTYHLQPRDLSGLHSRKP